jgi:hypothetical protein
MTLEGARKNFCPFYAEIDPAILDGGNSGLGNPGEIGELALAQFWSSRRIRTDSPTETSIRFVAGRNSFMSGPPVIMGSDLNDLNQQDAGGNLIDAPADRQDSVKHHCQAVPQRELVRKSCSFITFYFYVLSLEYPQALSSSI